MNVVLVTGGAGYIGSRETARRWHERHPEGYA
jgi:nucleoside-diphosphate-sugar epimerase